MAAMARRTRAARLRLRDRAGPDDQRPVPHLLLAHAAGRHGRRADPDAGGHERAVSVERNRVLVHDDARPVQRRGRFLAGQARCGDRSTSIRWLSVPPETSRKPALAQTLGQGLRVRDDLPAVVLELRLAWPPGSRRPWRRSCASAGRPGCRGRPAGRCLSANSSRQRIKPLRGPRRVLCVVVVTKSAYGTGLGWQPAATSPAMCAMSTISSAPTSSAICAEPLEIEHARVGAGAGHDQLRAGAPRPARASAS